MKLSDTLKHQLFEASPFHGGPRIFEAYGTDGADEGSFVRCAATGAETLGCALGVLEVHIAGKQWTDAALATFANQASNRIGYLLERLRPIEFDRKHHQVLLRSDRPRIQGGQSTYFELIANHDRTAAVRRYAIAKGTHGRTELEFVLTAEQLEILIDDLVEICATTK